MMLLIWDQMSEFQNHQIERLYNLFWRMTFGIRSITTNKEKQPKKYRFSGS